MLLVIDHYEREKMKFLLKMLAVTCVLTLASEIANGADYCAPGANGRGGPYDKAKSHCVDGKVLPNGQDWCPPGPNVTSTTTWTHLPSGKSNFDGYESERRIRKDLARAHTHSDTICETERGNDRTKPVPPTSPSSPRHDWVDLLDRLPT